MSHSITSPKAVMPWHFAVSLLVSLAVMGLLAFVGLRGLERISRQTNVIVDRNLEGSVDLADIVARSRALSGDLYRLTALRAAHVNGIDTPRELDHIGRETDELITDLKRYRDDFAQPGQTLAIDEIIAPLESYRRGLNAVGPLLDTDITGAVAYIRAFNGLFDRLGTLLRDMTRGTMDDAHRLTAKAAAATRDTTRWFVVITIAMAGALTVFAWALGKRQQRIVFNTITLEQEVAERTTDLIRTAEELGAAKMKADIALVEMRNAQSQLVEAEKMAALGSLVAGIAHEINTPIGTSLTAASLLADRTHDFTTLVAAGQIKKADLKDYLELADECTTLVQTNINRAAQLIHSFKQVAVDQTSAEWREFDLASYLGEVLISLRPRLRKSALEVSVNCPPDLTIRSFPGAFAQVVTNLVMNTLLHAFEDDDHGRLDIEVTSHKDKVRMVFRDNGKGIAERNLSRIFEPFFTTRRGTGGTGLGLHIVYNIVSQQLGGSISVDSEEGTGTSFTVTIAKTVEPATDRP